MLRSEDVKKHARRLGADLVGKVEAEALPKEAEKLIAKREEARKAKDWATADALRLKLKEMGVVVEDTPQGAKWRLKKK